MRFKTLDTVDIAVSEPTKARPRVEMRIQRAAFRGGPVLRDDERSRKLRVKEPEGTHSSDRL